MARLRARVRTRTGHTTHYHLKEEGTARLAPKPYWVEIEESPNGVYLVHLSEAGDELADTWHRTKEEAKRQAHHEFAIEEEDWGTIDEN